MLYMHIHINVLYIITHICTPTNSRREDPIAQTDKTCGKAVDKSRELQNYQHNDETQQ